MMAQFKNFIPPEAYVVRDSRISKINANEIVRGDVIILKAGSKIPCDVIVFTADQLTVNNSSLTGEVHEITITPGAAKERITES